MFDKEALPFGFRDNLGYLLGVVVNNFSFTFASTYIMVFYTKVMGVPATIVGTMFLIARFLDAFTDIGMGRIIDSYRIGTRDRFRPWLKIMMVPVALSSFLMYQAGLQGAPMPIKIAYMYVTYLLWGSVCYTLINIPYGSMASVISSKSTDRSSLSVFRSMGGMLAGILISVVAPIVVYAKEGEGNTVVVPRNFTLLAGAFSLCAIVCYLLCLFLTTERVKTDIKKAERGVSSLQRSLKAVFMNRSMLGVIVSALLFLLASLLSQGLSTYLFADYFNNAGALSLFSVLTLPAALILALTSTKLAERFGKKEVGIAGCIFSGVMYCVMGLLHIQGVIWYIVLAFLAMLGYNFFAMQCYAMVTDVIDDHEVRSHNRDDGTIYGIYSFSRKLGQALAGGVSGWALTAIGYNELAVVQTQSVRDAIYYLITFLPGILFLLIAITLVFLYPLSKDKVVDNVEELRRRREERTESKDDEKTTGS